MASRDLLGRPHPDRQRNVSCPGMQRPLKTACAARPGGAGRDRTALVEQIAGGCVTQAGRHSNNVTRTASARGPAPADTCV